MSDEAPQGGGDTPEQPIAPPAATDAPAPMAAAPEPVAAAPEPTAAAPEPVAAAPESTTAAPAAVEAGGAPPAADDPFGGMDQASIDELLRQASFDDPSTTAAAEPEGEEAMTAVAELPETSAMNLPNFNQVMRDAQVSSIDLLRDVDLNVKIELGRSRMLVEDVLKLSEGSVVELDKLAGDPVDVFVNERLVARGEVLVLNDNFCVRINEIVAGVKEEGL